MIIISIDLIYLVLVILSQINPKDKVFMNNADKFY